MIESGSKIDESLKLGAADDELVDTIVSTAKTGMGVAGNFIPLDQMANAAKTNKPQAERRKIALEENMGNISKTRSAE